MGADTMRVALVVVGALLLLIGLGGALFGFFAASGAEAVYNLSCTGNPSPPPAGFCQTVLSSIASYRAIAYGMLAVFVLGIGLAITGAILQEPQRMVAPPMMPPPAYMPMAPMPADPGRACRNCGRIFPSANVFCPYCGTAV